MNTQTATQKIVPCVWLDHTAEQAAQFYETVFRDTQVDRLERYPEDADALLDFQREFAGQALTIELSIAGFHIVLLNAGGEFAPNPSLNFMVHFDPASIPDARGYLDQVHAKLLADGGFELMPLQEYDFSPHYAWVQDKYGVSWQLMQVDPASNVSGESIAPDTGGGAEGNAGDVGGTNPAGGPGDGPAAGGAASPTFPFIMPSFMFGGDHQNECADAIDSYLSLFPDAQPRARVTYGQIGGARDMGPDIESPVTEDSIVYSDFALGGVWFTAMDSGAPQPFTFSEGVSLIINCADQDEIDRYWAALSKDPAAEACGWCRDAFGVSWQVVPEDWPEISKRPGAFRTMLQQKKIVLADY